MLAKEAKNRASCSFRLDYFCVFHITQHKVQKQKKDTSGQLCCLEIPFSSPESSSKDVIKEKPKKKKDKTYNLKFKESAFPYMTERGGKLIQFLRAGGVKGRILNGNQELTISASRSRPRSGTHWAETRQEKRSLWVLGNKIKVSHILDN